MTSTGWVETAITEWSFSKKNIPGCLATRNLMINPTKKPKITRYIKPQAYPAKNMEVCRKLCIGTQLCVTLLVTN